MKVATFASLALSIALACVNSGHAAAGFNGIEYSQNFDGLGPDGSPWANNVTLPGWYVFHSIHGLVLPGRADPDWEPWPPVNLGTDTNRALGSQAVMQRDQAFALVLRNETTIVFTNFTLAYFAEQWLINSANSSPTVGLDFAFGVFPSLTPQLEHNLSTIIPHRPGNSEDFNNGYTDPPDNALDAFALRFGSVVERLDGHDPANRARIASAQPVLWKPGEYLVLRWFNDQNLSAQEPLLAIDDLRLWTMPYRPVLQAESFRRGFGFRFNMLGRTGTSVSLEVSTNLVSQQFSFCYSSGWLAEAATASGVDAPARPAARVGINEEASHLRGRVRVTFGAPRGRRAPTGRKPGRTRRTAASGHTAPGRNRWLRDPWRRDPVPDRAA